MSTRAEPTEVPDHDGLDIRSALDDPTAAAGQLAAILLAEATSTFRGRVPIDGIAQLVTAGCYTRSLSRPPAVATSLCRHDAQCGRRVEPFLAPQLWTRRRTNAL